MTRRKSAVSAVQTHLIRSRHIPQTFKIQVMPPIAEKERVPTPVVYATDGNLAFDILKGLSYLIQTATPDAPRFMLVGIGYPSDLPQAGAFLRGRDLIFPGYPKLSRQPPTVRGALLAEAGTQDSCGAEEFQRFIGDELVPYIDSHYETLPGDRTYFGHSAGGGFGLFTLLNRPDDFTNYLISSPGLSFHGTSSAGVEYEHYEFVLAEVKKFVASGRGLQGKRLYLSVGSEEELDPAYASWQLTSSHYRLVAFLRAARIPGLDLTTEVLPEETHATAWPVAFLHGIRKTFIHTGHSCTRRTKTAK